MSDIYVADETFTTTVDGAPVVIRRGKTRVRAGHPVLEGREHLFKPLTVDYDVEQATAAPGEKRRTQVKAKPGPKKK